MNIYVNLLGISISLKITRFLCVGLWIKIECLQSELVHFIFLLLFLGSYVLVWQKGDDVLTAQSIMVSPDRRFKLLPDHTLELRNIKPSDGGDYSCKISVLGDPIEITHTLEILCKCIHILFHL